MQVTLDSTYPATPAEVHIENSVGLSDEDVSELRTSLAAAGQDAPGECYLFQLLQTAKDFVNSRNTPSDDCCICLCAFDQDEQFFKTTCGHCFHLPCIAHWVHDQQVQTLERSQGETNAIPEPTQDSDDEEGSGGGGGGRRGRK